MTIAQQIRDALAASDEPLDVAELAELCSEAVDSQQIARACHNMIEAGVLTREKPPEGGRYRYRLADRAAPAHDDDDEPRTTTPEKPTSALEIAINDAGVLMLRRGKVALQLSADERARIEAFIARFGAA